MTKKETQPETPSYQGPQQGGTDPEGGAGKSSLKAGACGELHLYPAGLCLFPHFGTSLSPLMAEVYECVANAVPCRVVMNDSRLSLMNRPLGGH